MRDLWRGLAIVIMAGAACGGATLGSDGGRGTDAGGGATGGGGAGGGGGNRWTGTIGPPNRNLDILFMVDDSSSMRLAQTNLLNNFPAFMTSLQSAPQGLPNVHIAVISQDMGAGDGSISGCDSTGGNQGIFQYTARGTCTATNLQAGATYISNIGGVANYTGNLADVFSCIAALGESGCGFEQQFKSILRALGADGQPPPAENQGFLRPDAALAIVMVTNEDDCSAAPGTPLYDTKSNVLVTSEFGPPSNYRCNEFGHLCSMGSGAPMHPVRDAPNNNVSATVTYDQCTSNDTDGYLLSVKDTADKIRALKADPSRISVVSISGGPTPYVVHWKNPATADTSCGAASCPWPEITHSCMASDGSFGDPGVREAQLVHEFGSNGLLLSVCDASYAPSLDRVAQMLNSSISGPLCIPGAIGLNSMQQPDCTVTVVDGGVSHAVPSCADVGGAAPCWQAKIDAACGQGRTLAISYDPNTSAASLTVSYSCAKCTSAAPSTDCY
jgi:hypothetical protein